MLYMHILRRDNNSFNSYKGTIVIVDSSITYMTSEGFNSYKGTIVIETSVWLWDICSASIPIKEQLLF